MKPSPDYSDAEPFDRDLAPHPASTPVPDVPGMLATRIGELWASEERAEREARATRFIQAASQLPND